MRKMKQTSCQWVGSIPSNWTVEKIKFLIEAGDDGMKIGPYGSALRGKTIAEGPVKVYNQANLIADNFDISRHFISAETYEELKAYTIKPGDILFSMMGTIGKCKIMPKDKPLGIMDSHLLKARLNQKVLPKFFMYAFDKDNNSVTLEQLIYMSQGSIMNGLNSGVVKTAMIAVPPLPEQQAIVRYLDAKCATIDEAIERHKGIIEKLEEYKKSKIAYVVVNGLNSDVAKKDSGVEWIRQIPITWKVLPLKSMFTFGKGLSITKADLVEEGVPVLSYGQIHSKGNLKTEISEDLIRYVPLAIAEKQSDSLATVNGFIFADTSEDLTGCGNCNYVDRDGIYGGYHTIILKPNTSENNKYLAYLFQTDAWRYQIRKALTEVKVFSVSQKVLKNTWVLVPPPQEQGAIVSYLDALCKNIASQRITQTNIISKLEEYKKSIIYNAVTGKIDCRTEMQA